MPDNKRVALDQIAVLVCAEYERSAADKNLHLYTKIEPLRLFGDPVAIERIVRNLVDNAIKYTERGTVTVCVRSEGEGDAAVAIVSVTDTGIGIPAGEKARIFEEFYQLDNPGRDRGKGVGLGLAIVKRLCELIDAEIAVESAPGGGTSFSVRLRGVLAESAQATVTAPPSESTDLHGRSVYLIDDEADILHSTQQLLSMWGMRVATAASASAAQRLFDSSGKPELLISDLRLRGDENGAELASRLRKTYPGFPTLIITGEVSAAAIRQVAELGAVLLYKPLTSESLHRAILQALTQAGAAQLEAVASLDDQR